MKPLLLLFGGFYTLIIGADLSAVEREYRRLYDCAATISERAIWDSKTAIYQLLPRDVIYICLEGCEEGAAVTRYRLRAAVRLLSVPAMPAVEEEFVLLRSGEA